MPKVKKALLLLSTAAAMGAVSAEADVQAPEEEALGDQVDKEKKDAKKKKPASKVKRARRRPADWDADMGMPAGTLYDLIAAEDVPV